MDRVGFHTLLPQNKYHLLSLFFIILYVFPWFFLGEDAFIRIGDNLDGNVVRDWLLIKNDYMFAPSLSKIPNIMNGLPRISFGTEMNLIPWLYAWFGIAYGHAINQLLLRLVAYYGMYLLLKTYILDNRTEITTKIILHGVAVAFALLPFWPPGGLSVAGLPLVLFSFLNIYQSRDRWIDWLIIILIPFYSSFVLTYFFFLALVTCFFIYDLIKTKKFHRKLFLALSIMTSIFLIVNYRLVFGMLLPSDFVSHRTEMSIAKAMGSDMNGFYQYIRSVIHYIVYGHHAHIATFHTYAIGFSLLLATVLTIKKWNQKYLLIMKLLFLIIIFSFILKLWYYPAFDSIKEYIPIFKQFNMSRIAWINPLLWYLIFALSLGIIAKQMKFSSYIISILLIMQIGYLFFKSDFFAGGKSQSLTFKEFYASEMFQSAKKYLHYDANKSKVACLGFYPAVAQYNGIYTVGGYSSNYPLSYKHEFRKIIEKTLENNPALKNQFDNWGSYCYLRVSQLKSTYMGRVPKKKVIDVSELNFQQMRKLNVQYLFSSYELEKNPNITLLHVFTHREYPWKLHVYQIRKK